MHKGVTFWVVCLSLVLTRLVGLHLHACACIEKGVKGTEIHLADNGLIFGEDHIDDDGHDREMDPAVAMAGKIFTAIDDVAFPLPSAPLMIVSSAPVPALGARGPPAALPSRPQHFTPPLRGPPANSLV